MSPHTNALKHNITNWTQSTLRAGCRSSWWRQASPSSGPPSKIGLHGEDPDETRPQLLLGVQLLLAARWLSYDQLVSLFVSCEVH